MRKFLLASVATLGTGGLMGAAFAQAPAGPVGGPTQGQVAWPLANPLASVNTNNNYQAPALPGPLANPTPGTIVIHVAGKVQTTFQSSWSSLDQRTFVAPAGAAGGPNLLVTAAGPGGGIVGATVTPTSLAFVQGVNGTGTAKVAPTMLNSFMRLYFGADAMATNGLRYGMADGVESSGHTSEVCDAGCSIRLTRRQGWPQYIVAVGSIGSGSEPMAIIFAGQHIPPIRRKQQLFFGAC
jgi:hypothetical protein